MPEAIATTKRKFYKALDSLNTAPPTYQSEPSTKRIRRGIPSTSTLTRPTSVKSADQPHNNDRKEPPNFSPWSHETFLARLKTFSSVSLWHPKPEPISEVEWAKRGWVCVGVNTVACRGGCESQVVVSLEFESAALTNHDEDDDAVSQADDADEAANMEEALVKRYQALIAESHAETCMWRKAGCKSDIYRLQVVRPSIWQPELRARYHSLLDIADSTKDVRLRDWCDDTVASPQTSKLPEELPEELLGKRGIDVTSQESLRALDIAIHGWRGSSDSGTDLLHCDACFQRVGLWMYQPGYKPTRSSFDEDDATDLATIDLIQMHREHCPWRNSSTQQASGSLSGLNAFQILWQMVMNFAREARRRSKDAQHVDPLARKTNIDDGDNEEPLPTSPALSRAEVVKQDKERETRLRKLKTLFTVKRRNEPPASTTAKAKAAK